MAQKSQRSRKAKSSKIVVHSRYGVKIAHHKHTGRRISFRHTSYVLLFFVLILTGATLLFAGQAAQADQQAQGDIALSGTVNGPPPSTAATITSPYDGQRFSTDVIDVKGSCTSGLLVEIYRNAIFAGSVYCTNQDDFSLGLTLAPGQNDLQARIRDGAAQYGPDSAVVHVFYDVPNSVPSSTGSGGGNVSYQPARRPFLIYTTPLQRGLANGQPLKLKYEINGGKPPYAISINWGDGSKNSVYSLKAEGDFYASHQFKQAGQFTVSISGADAYGTQAFIQTTAVMAGLPLAGITQSVCDNPTNASSGQCVVSNWLQRLVSGVWPAFIVACLMTMSFWLGERVIYRRLPRRLRHAY